MTMAYSAVDAAVLAADWEESATALLWAIAGVLLGGMFTYVATRTQQRYARHQADRDRLLRLRTDVFRRLWGLTKPLQRNLDIEEIQRLPIDDLVDRLNDWYFDDGGMYMTEACRRTYFALLEELFRAKGTGPHRSAGYESLYAAASKLRATIAYEIDARATVNPSII